MPYKRLEQEIEEFSQFLGSFALSAAHSIDVKNIIPYDPGGRLAELLNIAEQEYVRLIPSEGINYRNLQNLRYVARQFESYLRDERVKPSLSGIFPEAQDIENVATLSDRLAIKLGRAIRLLEKKQKNKE